MLKNEKEEKKDCKVWHASDLFSQLYATCFCQIFRESTGTASVDDTSFGDPVQKAEAMAFRRACARFGLGLHLYHEDLS